MRLVREYGAPQQISAGLASCLRYCSDVTHRRPTKLQDVWPSPGLVHYVYIFRGSCSLTEVCLVQNLLYVQVLHSSIFAALLQGTPAAGISQTLLCGTRNGTSYFCRGHHIFGWAAITLGIGPHSSSLMFKGPVVHNVIRILQAS